MLNMAMSENSTKVLLLGSGELGKEIAIECQRLGIEVIACDRYPNAPAMQVAHRGYVFDMMDSQALTEIIATVNPDYIVPEIEAINTDTLLTIESTGITVVPNAVATSLTMDREKIRTLAKDALGLPTSDFYLVDAFNDFSDAISKLGFPCISKPIMSSSGKGQSKIQALEDVKPAWEKALSEARGSCDKVMIESFIEFDFEITLLTVSAVDGIFFCDPIGHRQANGDFQESWQPQAMSTRALQKSQQIAKSIVTALGGYGIFGVELFIKGDDVYFNEVSPRPHDTGLVTLISQDTSEFALHVRAFLKCPIKRINSATPSACAALLAQGQSTNISFLGITNVLSGPEVQLRLFAKPEINGERRLGVTLAKDKSVEKARKKAITMKEKIRIQLN